MIEISASQISSASGGGFRTRFAQKGERVHVYEVTEVSPATGTGPAYYEVWPEDPERIHVTRRWSDPSGYETTWRYIGIGHVNTEVVSGAYNVRVTLA